MSSIATKGSFEWALIELREGHQCWRHIWEKWQYIKIQKPDHNSKMTLAYFYITPQEGLFTPWNPNQIDMMAQDWESDVIKD